MVVVAIAKEIQAAVAEMLYRVMGPGIIEMIIKGYLKVKLQF